MPKKRHQTLYSKPQTTAPASLFRTDPRAGHQPSPVRDRSVNELIASARRASLKAKAREEAEPIGSGTFSVPAVELQQQLSSVPPAVRQALHLPEGPAPPPPRTGGARGLPLRPNHATGGRRPPPGPPPPRSWLAQSRHAPRSVTRAGAQQQSLLGTRGRSRSPGGRHGTLPDTQMPPRRSLTDLILRKLAADWKTHREYNRYYLYSLPSVTRTALLSYLNLFGAGVTASDLQLILTLPSELTSDFNAEDTDTAGLNDDLTSLDLNGAIGATISLREVTSCLFPANTQRALGHSHSRAQPGASHSEAAVSESWDQVALNSNGAADDASSLPRPLLPRLTHLSLALAPPGTYDSLTDPQKMMRNTTPVSWKHLLALAQHLPTLTHLSLAYWPPPTFTPNSKFTTVTTPQGTRLTVSGTGPYSHSLDEDWSEAILVLRRLSKFLYSLEYLNLAGCSAWWAALAETADRDFVDWAGDWGKITELDLRHGYEMRDEVGLGQAALLMERRKAGQLAVRIERHIRTKRAGRGRCIEVQRDFI